jgi:hypothetical protein
LDVFGETGALFLEKSLGFRFVFKRVERDGAVLKPGRDERGGGQVVYYRFEG